MNKRRELTCNRCSTDPHSKERAGADRYHEDTDDERHDEAWAEDADQYGHLEQASAPRRLVRWSSFSCAYLPLSLVVLTRGVIGVYMGFIRGEALLGLAIG